MGLLRFFKKSRFWVAIRKAKKRKIRVFIAVVKNGQLRFNTVFKKG